MAGNPKSSSGVNPIRQFEAEVNATVSRVRMEKKRLGRDKLPWLYAKIDAIPEGERGGELACMAAARALFGKPEATPARIVGHTIAVWNLEGEPTEEPAL